MMSVRRNATTLGPRPTLRLRRAGGAPVSFRGRVARALQRCSATERAMLALLLVEHLTPVEASQALGISARSLETRLRALLRRLEACGRGAAFTSRARTEHGEMQRRAS